MVKTGARAQELDSLVRRAGWMPVPKPPSVRSDSLPPELADDVLRMYRELGGPLDTPRLAPGAWDLAYSGLVVELDESFHFNRYRAVTLGRDWAATLPWARDYGAYCLHWERYAGTGGRRWSNDSAKRMFGGADPEGDFTIHGAPRWKQRALYDSMKDAAAASGAVALARVSIYDVVDGVRLDDILYGKVSVSAERVADFVLSRSSAGHS